LKAPCTSRRSPARTAERRSPLRPTQRPGPHAHRNLLHGRAAHKAHFAGALARTGRFDALIRAQAATRGRWAAATGPLEHYFRNLETTIGDRAAKMTNKHRADAFQLLTAKHNTCVDEEAWTDLIGDHLAGRKGHATHQPIPERPSQLPKPSLSQRPCGQAVPAPVAAPSARRWRAPATEAPTTAITSTRGRPSPTSGSSGSDRSPPLKRSLGSKVRTDPRQARRRCHERPLAQPPSPRRG